MLRNRTALLVQADRLIAEGEALCRQQTALLAWYSAEGRDTVAAETLLARLEQGVTAKRLRRAKLRDEFELRRHQAELRAACVDR